MSCSGSLKVTENAVSCHFLVPPSAMRNITLLCSSLGGLHYGNSRLAVHQRNIRHFSYIYRQEVRFKCSFIFSHYPTIVGLYSHVQTTYVSKYLQISFQYNLKESVLFNSDKKVMFCTMVSLAVLKVRIAKPLCTCSNIHKNTMVLQLMKNTKSYTKIWKHFKRIVTIIKGCVCLFGWLSVVQSQKNHRTDFNEIWHKNMHTSILISSSTSRWQ